MKPICLSLFLVLSVGLFAPARGDNRPVTSRGDLFFWADGATFHTADSLGYQEIYLELPCQEFAFKEVDGRRRADYRLEVTLQTETGQSVGTYALDGTPAQTLVWENNLLTNLNIPLGNQVAVEAFGFRLPPGVYQLHLLMVDRNTDKEGACILPIALPDTPASHLGLSEIQFAHRIDGENTEGRLLKNGLWVVPNVRRNTIGNASPLRFYYEIYGLAFEEGGAGTFDLAYALLDSGDYRVKTFSSFRYRKPGPTSAKTESLDLGGLPAGRYLLEISVRDNETGEIARRTRSFSILEPSEPALPTYPGALKRYYDQIRPIATGKELETYRSLSPEEKVEFILKFWKDRDPTPDTPQNEFAAEHFRRIRYADESFSARPRQRGSETDKGRIHIKYGFPSDIERSPFSARGKPYEIWTYEHLDYYKFVFVDRLGDSVYEMVHSTMPGERYNPSWRDEQAIGDQADPTARPTDWPSGDEPTEDDGQ